MLSPIKYLVEGMLKKCNLGIMNYDALQTLVEERDRAYDDIAMLLELADKDCSQLLRAFRSSKSQLRQDLFVLSELGFKRDGFFVEFGATNGVDLSNTYLLEREFGWKGILAEPARRWHEDLKKNRNCYIETHCVWRNSDSTLTFNEVEAGELSTIDSYSSLDLHHKARRHGKTYSVKTISLKDLLDRYNAPKEIDYLSIDTEGSEYEILSSFDFDKYRFKIITCEHNFSPQRKEISSLLIKNGYELKFDRFSKFDDWYVNSDTGWAAHI